MDTSAFRHWRKSTRSSGNPQQCVEVGEAPQARGVRDSKLGDMSPILAFDHNIWTSFVAHVKDGQLDR